MIRLALTMGWSMTAGGMVGNLIRRFVVPRLHLIPGMRNKILDSKPSALHPLALVQKSRRPRQLAGTLCPNPFLANGNHLDTELWTGFALITTTPLSSSERVLLEERGAIVHTAEPGSELADWLRRGHATAAIVRPDRTVMRASRNARALRSHARVLRHRRITFRCNAISTNGRQRSPRIIPTRSRRRVPRHTLNEGSAPPIGASGPGFSGGHPDLQSDMDLVQPTTQDRVGDEPACLADVVECRGHGLRPQ